MMIQYALLRPSLVCLQHKCSAIELPFAFPSRQLNGCAAGHGIEGRDSMRMLKAPKDGSNNESESLEGGHKPRSLDLTRAYTYPFRLCSAG